MFAIPLMFGVCHCGCAISGGVVTVAGTGNPDFIDGLYLFSAFQSPGGIAFDSLKNTAYIADFKNNRYAPMSRLINAVVIAADGAMLFCYFK